MKTYNLTSQKIGLSLTIMYDEGYLKSFEIDFKTPLNPEQADLLFKNIPYKEQYIQRLVNMGFKTTIAMPTNEKIALFCRFYEKHVNVKYKVSPSDSGKMKHIQLTEEMLQHYFTTAMFQIRGKYSVSNLVKYYNELLAEIAQKGKPQLPNTWSQDFAAKLSGTELSAYYAHLRRLGLKPKRDRNNNVTDWE